MKSASGPWDLVFVDPPYAMPNEQVSELLEALTPKLAEGAMVVVERSSRDPEPVWGEGLYCFRPVSTARRFSTMWSLTRRRSRRATSSATNLARMLKSSPPKIAARPSRPILLPQPALARMPLIRILNSPASTHSNI